MQFLGLDNQDDDDANDDVLCPGVKCVCVCWTRTWNMDVVALNCLWTVGDLPARMLRAENKGLPTDPV